ncbi:outer membrane beta-barrel protein [Pontibacter arcticus]|uniref:Outer membrane protein beta-barrel domain-containing protein n=1 Tax=Pontibacter arcticus TaxID=2080288 RepID=A0A364RII1_9BACT|nr:BT1926 family outer membrane beta-barrel protein [Pontibacter arcticus]RAU84083.1 hypothetical protein DP923_03275 [Pontibacter arcticus]
MKRIFIAFALLLATVFSVQAQDSDNTYYKPNTGALTTEVLFTDFARISLNNGLVRGRYFLTEQSALRLGLGIDYNYNQINDEAHSTSVGITLAPGIEKHFNGTNRLSPYVGLELPLSIRASSYDDEDLSITGATDFNGDGRGYIGAGLNAVAGVDFYFVKNFYVGLEIGAGINYRKFSDMEISSDVAGNSRRQGFSNLDFSQFANGGLRIGFAF